jgi:hypothetical protein
VEKCKQARLRHAKSISDHSTQTDTHSGYDAETTNGKIAVGHRTDTPHATIGNN